METALSLKDISYTYQSLHGETKSLDAVSFSIMPGEFAAIVGPSGCGKTTLLNVIAGLLKDYEGTLTVQKPIGYMFQKDQLLEWRSIYKNVILGLEIKQQINEENLARVNAMLKRYGLYEFRNAYPRQLSGGMRQRAALVRTLALSPKLLLLDEPFSALDAQTRLQVSNDIGSIIKQEHISTVMVTHDLQEAVSMADKVFVLSHRPGRIVKEMRISFTVDTLTPEERRKERQFNDYFQEIWREINEDDANES
ncbi:MAG: ABC transporter ATP-binding protein [Anaerostipes sp.]|uniref:ABC transporter ATP-binding protein n=1 Tax=Anaerostipes sp. 992a TaxID=1261637 RepID=UPI0009529DC8|nr:ABC transporter ATP-binding protein [Anaerostipes sp. 992a]MCI5952126.1 ABC transporter ATP-binding protein [Anaerostipes sp.]MDD5968343.1 ABC transporter ATP-binding protein [Anaerostipes sp.]OLR66067.1 spermidine/putrescine ABC transporter ATP-binding protein [Anaerostipes sp. 992a]